MSSKIGHDFSNKVVQKLTLEKNVNLKSYFDVPLSHRQMVSNYTVLPGLILGSILGYLVTKRNTWFQIKIPLTS